MRKEDSAAAGIQEIASCFRLEGTYNGASTCGSGHINDTYRVQCDTDQGIRRYILQKINTGIFREPEKLMENLLRITRHQQQKLQAGGSEDGDRKCLYFFPAKSGSYLHRDAKGGCWRVCQFVDRAHTCDVIESAAQAFLTAASFAKFQKSLVDLPGGRLHETIPDFHHTAKRFISFEKAVRDDAAGRVKSCGREIEFALSRKTITPMLIELMSSRTIPERITHNDTKLNNIMLDDASGAPLCVIDLDTVMPGSALYDFGDMVRSASCTAPEDEKDIGKVGINPVMFEALAAGYLSEAKAFLNDTEIGHLAFSGKLITFEQGIRFLTDHLNGDTYYKIAYPGHNLVRAQNQFALVASIERQEKALNAMVKKIVAG